MTSSQQTLKFKAKGLSVSSYQNPSNLASYALKKKDFLPSRIQSQRGLTSSYAYRMEDKSSARTNIIPVTNAYKNVTYTQIKDDEDISTDTKKFNQLIQMQKRKSVQIDKLGMRFQARREQLVKTERQPVRKQLITGIKNQNQAQQRCELEQKSHSSSFNSSRVAYNKSANSNNHGAGWIPHSYKTGIYNRLSTSRKNENRVEAIIVGLQQQKQHLKQKIIEQEEAQVAKDKFKKQNQMLQEKLTEMHKQIDYLKSFRDQSQQIKKQNIRVRLISEQNEKQKRQNEALVSQIKQVQIDTLNQKNLIMITSNQQPKQHKLVTKKTGKQIKDSGATLNEQQVKQIGDLHRQNVNLRQLLASFEADSKIMRLKIDELGKVNSELRKQVSDISQINNQQISKLRETEKELFHIKQKLASQRKAQVDELLAQLQQQKNLATNFKRQAQAARQKLQSVQRAYQLKLKNYENIPLQLDLKMKQIEQEKKALTKNYSRRLTQMQNQLNKFRFVLERQNSQKQLRVKTTQSQLKLNHQQFSRLISERDQIILDLQKRNQFLQSELIAIRHNFYQNGGVNNELNRDEESVNIEFMNLRKRFNQKVIEYTQQVKKLRESEIQVKKFMEQMNAFKQRQQKMRQQIRLKIKNLEEQKHSFEVKVRQLTTKEKQYLFQMEKLNNDNQFYKSMVSRLEQQSGQIQKKRGESQISKMQSEIYYLKTKNEQLKTQLISKSKQIQMMLNRRQQDRQLNKSQALSKYESYNYNIKEINSAFNNYEVKSQDLTQILKVKQADYAILKKRVQDLQNLNRDLRDRLAVANRKLSTIQQNKKYQLELIQQQKNADKQQYDRKINQLMESLNRKSKENLEKDKFITSFLVGRSQPETQVSNLLVLLQRNSSRNP